MLHNWKKRREERAAHINALNAANQQQPQQFDDLTIHNDFKSQASFPNNNNNNTHTHSLGTGGLSNNHNHESFKVIYFNQKIFKKFFKFSIFFFR